MAHTFDIRFDAAGNTLGWKGGGLLRIDAQGLNFALKRGIASLLARKKSQRIPAEKIREVYREGEVLRVEFTTDELPRATLPFRARDRDTAAHIVQLLPTSRTIEIERTVDEPRAGSATWRGPSMLAAGLAIMVLCGALIVMKQRPAVEPSKSPAAAEMVLEAAPQSASATASADPVRPAENPLAVLPEPTLATQETGQAPPASAPAATKSWLGENVPITPDEARKLAMLAEDPVDWTQPPPPSNGAAAEAAARRARMDEVEGFVPMEVPDYQVPIAVVPIKQTTLAYRTARALLKAFEVEAGKLNESYRRERREFDSGNLDARSFADQLDALAVRWRALSDGMLKNREYMDGLLGSLRATLLSVVIYQRVFLTGYGEGLRAGDQDRINRAFKDLAHAEEHWAHAQQYVN